MNQLLVATRVFLGLVFVLSLGAKLRAPGGFAEFVGSVRGLVPRLPARTTAVVVVAGEATVVVLLAWTRTVSLGLGVALLLSVAFTVALWSAIRRGRRVSCGCFGASTTPVGPAHVVRNVVLTACAAVGLAAGPAGADTWGPGTATSIAAGAVAAGLVALTDDVVDLFRA
ncbi:MauE/DoxX family redox-associated membrane protein [Embleya hyalina]|uniref:Methylamine utilisation protein MauE domain-containing protein n=1 Tax=Embleya hyalina TaxID=516124 RepID=A0A401YNF2_9ACTN|nr:MauE/DoxX family redox-associated membrane protein [Embleya hyalina]GCD96039.1 hypothetical protein EHYA_03723 [Embleya hyalina]